MTSESIQPKYNYWICFVDDDEKELARFKKTFDPLFHVRVGENLGQCLSQIPRSAPDLWVLDLYYPQDGVTNTKGQRAEMNQRFAALDQHRREFLAYLQTIGQGRDGGLAKLRECKKGKAAPVIMFTRKGTIDDAIACRDNGAACVLKKPMPADHTGTIKDATLNRAMEESQSYLGGHFLAAIQGNTHLAKHKGSYFSICSLVVGLIVGKFFDLGWTWLTQ